VKASPQTLLELKPRLLGNRDGLHYAATSRGGGLQAGTKFKRFGQVIASLEQLDYWADDGRGWTILAQARRYIRGAPDLAVRLLFQRPSLTL